MANRSWLLVFFGYIVMQDPYVLERKDNFIKSLNAYLDKNFDEKIAIEGIFILNTISEKKH